MNMLAMTTGQWFLGFVLMCTCLLLILVILLQRGRGGGLAGAFGGAGGSSAFGAKTGDVFTWITVVVATVFVLLSVVTNFVYDESGDQRAVAASTEEVPAAPTPGAPAPVVIDLQPDGKAVTTTPTGGDPVEVVPIDGPPPEIQKMIEEEQKKRQAQQPPPAGSAPVPPPGDATPATPSGAEEKKPDGAAAP